jgi:hypothetical protein
MNEDWAYDEVAKELQKQAMIPGVWARAFAEAGGDQEKARAMYIKLRVTQLMEQRARDEHNRTVKQTARRMEAIRSQLLQGVRLVGALVTGLLAVAFLMVGISALGEGSLPAAFASFVFGLGLGAAGFHLVRKAME